jgi:CheY-like chemotaxis protein
MKQGYKILWIEDSAQANEMSEKSFRRYSPDLELQFALTMATGLYKLKTEKYDLLISDLGLPDDERFKDARSFVKQLKKGQLNHEMNDMNTHALPLVILSGQIESRDFQLFELGHVQLIQKGFFQIRDFLKFTVSLLRMTNESAEELCLPGICQFWISVGSERPTIHREVCLNRSRLCTPFDGDGSKMWRGPFALKNIRTDSSGAVPCNLCHPLA